MQVDVNERGGFSHLALTGRIDSATAGGFEATLLGLLADRDQSVLVDLGGVDFVSSAGLRVFLLGAKKVKGTSARMVLCAMDANIRKVFAMSGFDRILEITEDVETGEARLAG